MSSFEYRNATNRCYNVYMKVPHKFVKIALNDLLVFIFKYLHNHLLLHTNYLYFDLGILHCLRRQDHKIIFPIKRACYHRNA